MQVFYDFRRFGLDDLAFRNLAEEYQGGDNRSWRKVDVKTPTPAMDRSQNLSQSAERPSEYFNGPDVIPQVHA